MLMADILSRMPDLRHRAQTLHVTDQLGHCRECGNGVQWPCDVYQIAVEAERLQSLPRPRTGLEGRPPATRRRVPTRAR